jgi:soluble lytic murein transglycosylase-like protein
VKLWNHARSLSRPTPPSSSLRGVRARTSLLAVILVALSACQTATLQSRAAAPRKTVPPDSSLQPSPARAGRGPGRLSTMTALPLARYLTRTDRRLRRDIYLWKAHGARLGSPIARRAMNEGLSQQRIYRFLAVHPSIARRVEATVGVQVLHEMHANLGAARELSSIVSPVSKVPSYHFAHPKAPRELRKLYATAQRRYGVPWSVLAAINFVESKFGRILGPSSSGALGPMQFLPATFAAYGTGDIKDPHDSILAAARYLHADGAPQRLRAALFAYNRAGPYVDAVLRYARQMRRNRWSFWAYYGYQVFVTTTKGSVRLTGPGTEHRD